MQPSVEFSGSKKNHRKILPAARNRHPESPSKRIPGEKRSWQGSSCGLPQGRLQVDLHQGVVDVSKRGTIGFEST